MPFTGVLGHPSSKLGVSYELGDGLPANSLNVSVSETLMFSESASYPRVENSASDTLSFVETATAGRRVNVSVSEQITFAENDPVIGPRYESTASRLNLSEEATAHLTLVHQLVSEGLVFVEVAGRRVPVSVAEVVTLAESTKPPTKASDVMALIEAVAIAKAQSPSDTLAFTESASVTGSFVRSASDAMQLIEAASFFLTNPSVECTYTPFIGGSNGSYTPPSATPPTLGQGTLTLTYPYTSPTTTLVLNNPDFGNTDRRTFNRLNQQTRGGTLIVFADPQWPKFKTLSIQIASIPDDKAGPLLQFLEDSLGLEIGLLDWDGRQWRGIITNPDAAVTQNGDCDYAVSIDFEGELA